MIESHRHFSAPRQDAVRGALAEGPGKDGVTVKFDDLPLPYRGNVDVQAPFDRHAGDQPALTEDDIKDIVTFLYTLTDGYESR